MEEIKKCSKCKIEKYLDSFSYDGRYENKLRAACKDCVNEYSRKNAAEPEKIIKKREQGKKYYLDTKEVKLKRQKERNKLPENKLLRREYEKEYLSVPKNKERVRTRVRKWEKYRYKFDILFRLRRLVSSSVRYGLKMNNLRKNSPTWSKLPYTPTQMKEYIEIQWIDDKSWMNWGNHGVYDPNRKTWQIDHIIPQSSFIFTSMDDKAFQECWALSNLQPLETLENISSRCPP